MWYILPIALFCSFATSCSAVEEAVPWWQKAIFYQVYPRSFKDSDGDGVGDLKGITQKAQYFKDIGVDAIWISPFYKSPMADFGYDISNFTGIDPTFGTMDDFRALAKAFEDVGVKLVVDFVPNHSSDEHPWFQQSVDQIDPYTDYYIWNDGIYNENTGNNTPPNNWMSVFSGSAWKWHEKRQQFYFHDFATKQPDLNFRNPAVVAEMERVIKFWLDLGVDGFRLDSANFMYEVEDVYQDELPLPGTDGSEWADYNHTLTQNQPETYALLERWAEIFYNYSVMDGGKPRALFVEVYTDLMHTVQYYGRGNTSLMQPFNFELLVHGNRSTRTGRIKEIIEKWIEAMPEGDVPNWVIGNHDNGRIADRYGPELVDTLNILTGVLPGIKVVYYGEEIGMQDTFIRWDQTVDTEGLILGPYKYMKASRDPERTPMQWDNSVSAGFSTNKTTWLPCNPNYYWLNVAAQEAASASHLKVFRSMAMARKDPVLRRGDLTVLAPDNDTLVVVRSLNGSGTYMLLMNFGSEVKDYNTTNFFAPNKLDMDMTVSLFSLGYDTHKVGDKLLGKSLSLSLRPKAAVLLRSVISSAKRLFLTVPLLLVVVFKAFSW